MFSAVAGRLFYLHILEKEKSRQIIAESRHRFDEAKARRGNIYDADGHVLACSQAVWDIGVDPVAVDVRDRSKLPYLALILNKSEEELESKIGWFAKRDKNSRRWVKLAGSVDESVFKAVNKLEVKGVYGTRRFRREYPMGGTGAHVVGFMNKADASVMGVELTMDYYLKGSSGWSVKEVAGNRREMRQYRVRDIEGQDGLSVQLTLDSSVQRFVEQRMDEVMEQLQPESVSVVVTEVDTGAIVAMGSRPGFDPNNFWDYDLEKVLRNRAVSDVYEPGSTFKIITAAGYLNDGIGDRDTIFDCATRSVFHRNRKVVLPTDTTPRGKLKLHEVIKKSSNRGSALAGLKLGETRFYEYCKAFGIGERTGVELNGEEKGIFRTTNAWDHYTLSRLAIGYGVGVTPLQMHAAMSVIANDGVLMKPYVVRRAFDVAGTYILDFEQQSGKSVVSKEVAREIRDCLIEAVSLSGTGSRARLGNIQVAGKTGTSRKLLSDGYSEERHVGSFSGFFPASNPEYVITVVVNDPQNTPSTYGGRVAAPTFRAIAEYIVATRGVSEAKGRNVLAMKGGAQ